MSKPFDVIPIKEFKIENYASTRYETWPNRHGTTMTEKVYVKVPQPGGYDTNWVWTRFQCVLCGEEFYTSQSATKIRGCLDCFPATKSGSQSTRQSFEYGYKCGKLTVVTVGSSCECVCECGEVVQVPQYRIRQKLTTACSSCHPQDWRKAGRQRTVEREGDKRVLLTVQIEPTLKSRMQEYSRSHGDVSFGSMIRMALDRLLSGQSA